MKLMQDVIKKRKLFQILSMIFVLLDLAAFVTMESLDITFSLQNEYYRSKLIGFVLKIIVLTVFISFLFAMLILKFRNTLMISSIAYLVIGVIIFLFMFINDLSTTASESRPPKYFDYHISTIIIVLNVLTGIFRITGSVMIMFFISILKIEKKRNESEKNENLMKINENTMKDTIILPSNENLHDYKAVDSYISKKVGNNERKDNSDNEVKMKKLRDSENKKFAQESYDSYKKFETPSFPYHKMSQTFDKNL